MIDMLYSASTIKGPYVASICRYNPGGIDGYVQGQMESAILYSSNEDYSALRSEFGGEVMEAQMNDCNVLSCDPYRNYVYYSARDLAKLWVGNYWYFYVEKNGYSDWCRDLYAEGLTGDNAIIHNALSDSYTTYAKPGWYPGGGYDVQNDAGLVMAGSHPYVISVLSSACGEFSKLGNLVRAIDAVHTALA